MTTDEHMEAFAGVIGSKKAFMSGDFESTETIATVVGMRIRIGLLFSEMIQGKIDGYRVEMDRSTHPATFHVTTWMPT